VRCFNAICFAKTAGNAHAFLAFCIRCNLAGSLARGGVKLTRHVRDTLWSCRISPITAVKVRRWC
jgi:hypothetical protein